MEKAVFRARDLGCSAMQVFSRNPRGWRVSPLSTRSISAFRKAAEKGDIDPIVVHTPYLLNLAAPDENLHERSVASLALDVKRAEQLGARFVVTHLGSAKAMGKEFGGGQVVKALRAVLGGKFKVSILLENSAGGGNSVGSFLEEFQELFQKLERDERLGVCFDSCHGFAAGYDFRSVQNTESLVRKIDQTIGGQRLALLHLNDSSGPLGSHRDRHEHIGGGKIGMGGFKSLLGHPFFRGIPMILETPKETPKDDLKNLARIRRILKEGEGN